MNFRKILTVGTQHLVSDDDPWNKVSIKPAVEWYVHPYVDILGEIVYVKTRQSEGSNTVEWRPDLGFRLNFFQQRWTFRTKTLFEYRHVRDQEMQTNENTIRFRTRVELVFPINNPSHLDPKTLYGLTDFEVFADLAGDDVVERFSNRNRFRIGAGWRFDAAWRVELIYTRQSSRSSQQQDFVNSSNIYRVRIKFQPLRKSPAQKLAEQPHH